MEDKGWSKHRQDCLWSKSFATVVSGPADPDKLRLITWNIDGLDEDDRQERTSAVCDILKLYAPDIVLLQEVVAPTSALIAARMTEYKLLLPGIRTYYFTAVMLKKSSVELLSEEVHPLEGSKQGRSLQIVQVNCAGIKLSLMCSHLESESKNTSKRVSQLKIAVKEMEKLSTTSAVIFGGDTNLRDREVVEAGVPSNIYDIWQLCGEPPEAQYSWDVTQNDNLDWPHPNKPRLRFDRLYLKQAHADMKYRVAAEQFSFIGKRRLYECQRFPSDHWGILCDFKVVMEK